MGGSVRDCVPIWAVRRLSIDRRRPPWVCSGARHVHLHLDADPGRRAAIPYFYPAAAPGKLTLIGTTVIFFTNVNWITIVPYFALGQFSTRNLATSALLLPLAVATNFLGSGLVRITPAERFYRIAYILMLLIAIALLWQGVRGICRALIVDYGANPRKEVEQALVPQSAINALTHFAAGNIICFCAVSAYG